MPRIEDLERLLAADPNDPFVLYGLAQEYAKTGDTGRAVEYYDRCLASDASYLYAYYHKAKALEAGGRASDARATAAAGLNAARKARDGKAASELEFLLDELGA